jgi:hypothetical protein
MAPRVVRFRRAGASDRGFAVLLALAGAGAGAAVALAPRFAPFVPACPFHAWTGLPCPSCGATRAVLALAAGDPGVALALHPLVTVGLVALAVASVLALPWVAFRGPLPVVASPLPLGRLRLAAAATLAVHWAWLVARGV